MLQIKKLKAYKCQFKQTWQAAVGQRWGNDAFSPFHFFFTYFYFFILHIFLIIFYKEQKEKQGLNFYVEI